MPKGDLREYINFEQEGIVYHTSITNQLKLGGKGNPRIGKYLLDVDEGPLDTVYMLLITSSNELPGNITWKINIDELSLSREFKPHLAIESSGQIYSVHLFDLSKVVRGGRVYTLSISCDSSRPVIVEGVELVGVKRFSGVTSELLYSAGCVALNPSEEYVTTTRLSKDGVGTMSILINMPSRSALVDIVVNNEVIKSLGNSLGVNDVLIPNINLGVENVLAVKHRPAKESYYPRCVNMYSILLYRVSNQGPNIVIEPAEIVAEEGCYKVRLEVRNCGDLPCENLILTGISAGNILFREIIQKLGVGESVVKTYRVDPKKVTQHVVVRSIYRKLCRQEVNEVRIPIKHNHG